MRLLDAPANAEDDPQAQIYIVDHLAPGTVIHRTLAIGDTESVTILLDKELAAGPWDARLTLHSGFLERSARATITFPTAGVAPPVITSTRPAWMYPAIAGLMILLVAALLLVVRRRRRRSHRFFGLSSV